MVAVGRGVAIFGQWGDLRVNWHLGESGLAGSPELIEVGRLLLGGLYGFGVKGGGRESAICFSVLLDGSDASKKAGFVHGAAIDSEAFGGERRSLIDFRRHHLGTDPVGHLDTAQRVAVLNGDDAKANGPAGIIAPIRPIGGHPNLDGTDAILCDQREGKKREEEEAKRGAT